MIKRPEDSMREIMDAQRFMWPCLAEVQSYSSSGPSVDVRPLLSLGDTAAPVLHKVPLQLPSGNGWRVEFKVSRGDVVLCLFCAHHVADWFAGRSTGKEMKNAEMSDAVAIPGFSKKSGRSADTEGLVLTNDAGTVKVELSGVNVNVTTPTGTIGLLSHTHSIPGGFSGPPTPGS